jgi:hypothetical protein
MSRLRHLLGFALCSLALAEGEAPQPIDRGEAARCFREAQALSNRDGGKLWGKPLYGPMLFVDVASRSVITNQLDAKGALHRAGEVCEGSLPKDVMPSNTAIEWSGTHWIMVMWGAVSENRHSRAKLMLHESFHRIQKSLGHGIQGDPCDHLDSKDGRIWLQLEWRALGEALVARGSARHRAIQDALLFRAYRRALFTGAAEMERNLELHEGLAEYTGIRVSARSEAQAIADALGNLVRFAQVPTFVRSFAYASGPAYGLLLDASAPTWRNRIKEQPDLGDLLRKALAIKVIPSGKTQALAHAEGYGLRELVEDETRRDEARRAKVAQFRARLVDGPVLILPRSQTLNYSFDPREVLPFGGLGTVYPNLKASDPWGTLEATDGALMTAQELRLPALANPSARPLTGSGWILNLAPEWTVSPGTRVGDYRLVKAAEAAASPGSGDAVK